MNTKALLVYANPLFGFSSFDDEFKKIIDRYLRPYFKKKKNYPTFQSYKQLNNFFQSIFNHMEVVGGFERA